MVKPLHSCAKLLALHFLIVKTTRFVAKLHLSSEIQSVEVASRARNRVDFRVFATKPFNSEHHTLKLDSLFKLDAVKLTLLVWC